MGNALHTESKPARDELLLATRRYNAMVAHDPDARVLPALAWRGIAVRLWIESTRLTGDRQVFVADRSTDAHHRADHAGRQHRACASLAGRRGQYS
jgi:hypothetical protein